MGLKVITAEQLETLHKLFEENVEIVEEDDEKGSLPEEALSGAGNVSEDEQVLHEELSPELETYECPECGAPITVDMTSCPNCGIGLSFEYEDE